MKLNVKAQAAHLAFRDEHGIATAAAIPEEYQKMAAMGVDAAVKAVGKSVEAALAVFYLETAKEKPRKKLLVKLRTLIAAKDA